MAKKWNNSRYRSAFGVALGAGFILIWVNGAVGIIGSESNDANLLYGGVLGVGLVGSIIVRFQPVGMARAMFATALAQVMVAVITLVGGFGSTGPSWPRDILMSTLFFTSLWLISALLFQKAAREKPTTGVESDY